MLQYSQNDSAFKKSSIDVTVKATVQEHKCTHRRIKLDVLYVHIPFPPGHISCFLQTKSSLGRLHLGAEEWEDCLGDPFVFCSLFCQKNRFPSCVPIHSGKVMVCLYLQLV